MTWALLALAVFAAMLVLAPVRILFDAPESGDLFLLRIRHPALLLDLWLPPAVVIAWTGKRLELPGFEVELFGVPFDHVGVTHLIARVRGGRSRKKKEPGKKEKPPEPEKPAEPLEARARRWLAIWERQKSRVARAGTISTMELDLAYGASDPATTAIVTGILWQLAVALPEPFELRAEPFWTGSHLDLAGKVRLQIFPWRLGWAVLCLALDLRRKAKIPEEAASDGGVRSERQRQHG